MKLALLATALTIASVNALAANVDFTLVNKTGYDINEVYVSPSNQQNWGPDRLGDYQLTNNDSKKMKFGDIKACQQDIKVVFTDTDEAEWEDFNLCEINTIILKYNRKTQEAVAEYD